MSIAADVILRAQFVSKYISTIGIDYGVKLVTVNGESVRINFWDLSGHPDFFEIRNEFYKDSQGVSAGVCVKESQRTDKVAKVCLFLSSCQEDSFSILQFVQKNVYNTSYYKCYLYPRQEHYYNSFSGHCNSFSLSYS